MAKIVLTNANVQLAGTDISSYVKQVTLTTSVNEVETTAFGNTAKTRVAGLIDNKIQLSLQQDYSAVEGLVYPLVGGTAVTVIVRPNGTGSASTANPQYSASVLVTEWMPVNGAVGDLATADVTWPISGTITKTP
ncbi:MAG: hypothetical protein WCG15_00555 [Actinomycetes bacterium]